MGFFSLVVLPFLVVIFYLSAQILFSAALTTFALSSSFLPLQDRSAASKNIRTMRAIEALLSLAFVPFFHLISGQGDPALMYGAFPAAGLSGCIVACLIYIYREKLRESLRKR